MSGCVVLSALSVLAPLATSRNTFLQPALVSWRTCASTLWLSVDTLAYPYLIASILHRNYASKTSFLSALVMGIILEIYMEQAVPHPRLAIGSPECGGANGRKV
jgi:hypothetical protein